MGGRNANAVRAFQSSKARKGLVSAGRRVLYIYLPLGLIHKVPPTAAPPPPSPAKYCFLHSASVPSCMAAATPLDVAIPLPPRRLASEQIDSSSEARRRAAAEAAAPLSSAAAAAFAKRAPVVLPATDAAVVRPRNWWRRASVRGQVRVRAVSGGALGEFIGGAGGGKPLWRGQLEWQISGGAIDGHSGHQAAW